MSVIFFRIPSHTPAVVSHSLWIRVPSMSQATRCPDAIAIAIAYDTSIHVSQATRCPPRWQLGPHSCQSPSRTSCKSDRKGPKTAGVDLLCRLCRCLSFCAIR
jgi:hypothetical protein